jgi:hypothetical protein
MKDILIFMTLMLMVAGCSSTKNPVSASSDMLQYTLSTAKETYIAHDTLHFALTVHNAGSSTDTVAIGDAILCTWSLRNASGAMMYSGENLTGNLIGLLPVASGESKVIDTWTHSLTDSVGRSLPTGSYRFAVDYGNHVAFVGLSVQ